MILPYRVKNPIKRFPIAAVSIIAANVIVYLFTTDGLVEISENALNNYALIWGHSPFYTFFTSMFLHADPFHLLGNMWFFAIFGPQVEDRAGVGKFLAIYFISGFCGHLLQLLLSSVVSQEALPNIGASGCIMGIAGAYWYLFSWSKVCVFYWFFWFIYGVWEIRALWVIGFYLLSDILEGVFKGAVGLDGGVANFAHVGALVAGGLLCLGMRLKRDEEEVSERKAFQADVKDLNLMPLDILQEMWAEDPENWHIVRAIVNHGVKSNNHVLIRDTLASAGPKFVDIDAPLVCYYIIDLHGDPMLYQPVYLLRLAGHMERNGSPHQAISIYRIIATAYPAAADTETALYKMASCYWTAFQDENSARVCLAEMQKRFPGGQMRAFAANLTRQMEVGKGVAES